MPLFLAFVFLTFVFRTVLFSLAVFLPFFSTFSESGTASSAPWETEVTCGKRGIRQAHLDRTGAGTDISRAVLPNNGGEQPFLCMPAAKG